MHISLLDSNTGGKNTVNKTIYVLAREFLLKVQVIKQSCRFIRSLKKNPKLIGNILKYMLILIIFWSIEL